MPGDGLTLTVRVSGKEQFFRIPHSLSDGGDGRFFVLIENVNRLELVGHAGDDLLLLVLFWNLTRLGWEIADVADARLDDEISAEVFFDGFGFGG